MSNAECVKRWQQKQKKRLEDAEAEVVRLTEENKRLQALVDRWVPKDLGWGGGA